MPVELTRNGTRGASLPRLPRPLMKAGLAAFNLVARARGSQLMMVTTYGSRSQREHSVPLRYFVDPKHADAWLVVASFGGTAKHPAWYVNMARNPERIRVELNGRQVPVRADSVSGAERAELWDFVVAQAPGYAEYQAKTDREIPIVRLTPLGT